MHSHKYGFNYFLCFILGMCFCFSLEAQPTSSPIIQTKEKLKRVEEQIKKLQQTLASAQDKQAVLNKELAHTEKQIGEGIRQLRSLQQEISSKEDKINALQETNKKLQKKLKQQQQLFASHVRARYQMGEYQPLKWLLNQDSPYQISRILTYYQYIVKSRQQLIDTIDETMGSINENKKILGQELVENKQLKSQLTEHQQKLTGAKQYHTELIKTLHNEIKHNQHALSDFRRDRANLSRLLKSLSQQSVIQPSKPFAQMRKKLPLPVQTSHKSLKSMNQGVTFFADEGTSVTAVYPGKVVFSDWLKGYGLLLIIDHGQGFMTLYAHNQSLFKRKGETVQQSEQIARVGHSGGIKQNGLYFEIRLRGKAVSPLSWLS